MTKNRFDFRSALLAVAASTALVACGGGGGGSDAASPASGTLRVALTDAPACGFDQVNVTVERVRMHTSAGAGDNDAGWSEIVLNPPKKVDLLTLQNGVVAELGQTTLPAGSYTQIRLVLASNGAGSPANSVRPTGGAETAMDTPSAMQSGLKLISPFTVQAGQITDIVLDFDACKSVVARGNGSFSLKPVMTMIPQTGAAISGYVQAVSGVTVSAQKNGVVVRATQPNANGQFVLAPIDVSQTPYEVVFAAPGHTTSVVTGVPVAKDQTTTVGSSASPVQMGQSNTGSVGGTVTPPAAADIASIRALQAVGSVPAIEVAHANPVAGVYALSLPLNAPLLATYAAPPAVLSFAAQGSSAKNYKVEASALKYVTQTKDVTVGSTAVVQNFPLVPTP